MLVQKLEAIAKQIMTFFWCDSKYIHVAPSKEQHRRQLPNSVYNLKL